MYVFSRRKIISLTERTSTQPHFSPPTPRFVSKRVNFGPRGCAAVGEAELALIHLSSSALGHLLSLPEMPGSLESGS